MNGSPIKLSLPVVGMTCASCTTSVDKLLNTLPGVSDITVDAPSHRVHLYFDPFQSSLQDIVHALEGIGYLVMNSELTLRVRGMTCASCAGHVERVLKALTGVEDAVVNLEAGTVRVKYVPSAVSPAAMKEALQQAGFDADEHKQSQRKMFPWGLKGQRQDR
jgi:Cu+-exporting ATPase